MTDTCRRTDEVANQVCDHEGDIYCLSNQDKDFKHFQLQFYPRLLKARQWAMDRTSFEDSLNGSQACYDGGEYYSCTPDSHQEVELECGDFFRSRHNCSWRNPKSLQATPIFDTYRGTVCKNSFSPLSESSKTDSEESSEGIINVIHTWKVVAIGFVVCTFVISVISLFIKRKKLKLAYKKYKMKKDKNQKEGYKEASQSENIELEVQDRSNNESQITLTDPTQRLV